LISLVKGVLSQLDLYPGCVRRQ